MAARKITSACDRIDGSRQNPALGTGPARERDEEKTKELVFLAERTWPWLRSAERIFLRPVLVVIGPNTSDPTCILGL